MDGRLRQFNVAGPADPDVFAPVERVFGVILPDGYKRFMLEYGGGEGWIGEHYLILWKPSELVTFNNEYEFHEYAPSLIAFASSGGGEAFAFDKRAGLRSVVMVPFIGMSDEDAIHVADSLDNLLARMVESADALF